MDLPERPAVWPPAPNVAPPESAKVDRPKLIVPEWMEYWFRSGIGLVVLSIIVRSFCEDNYIPGAMVVWFVIGGLLTLWKYWPRRK